MTNFPDIYFLPEWGQLFQEHDQAKVDIFEFKNDLGHVYYQFMKRKLPENLGHAEYCDTVTPYGFNGPIVLESKPAFRESLVIEFDKAFQGYCMENNIVSEYIRFNPWLKNHLDFEKIYTTKYNNYTLFTNLTIADFFMQEFSTKTRNHVRKAQKSGVYCEFDPTGTTINEFSRIYELTVKKNDVSDYYLFSPDFLYKTFSALKDKQFLVNAKYKDQTISSAIFLHYSDYLHYHLCANDPAFYPLCANSLILYEAAKWGVAHGKKQLHLGGAFSEELFTFKREFTKKGICDYFVGKKIRNNSQYNELVDIKQKKGTMANKSYFPIYRG